MEMEFPASADEKYTFLTVLFVLALAAANIIASKIVVIFGIPAPAGIIVYPVTFMVTDVVSEAYGKGKAKRVVWTGFAMMILFLLITQAAIYLPPAPFYRQQAAFRRVLGASSRIILASLVAYLASQTCDVALFHFWKRVTKDRHLWLRNNLATMTAQLIDTALFIFIAFYGTYGFEDCLGLIGGQYLFKFVFALLDTPFVYLGVWWAGKKVHSTFHVDDSL